MNPLTTAAKGCKIVLGHDWLTGMRGGERVLQLHCEAFPDAPLVSLFGDPTKVSEAIKSRQLVFSALQSLPRVTDYYRYLLPIMGRAARSIKVPAGDLLLTTSHCVAKSFVPSPGMRHLCYCFTPMRYAWVFPEEYLGSFKAKLAAPILAHLRRWDRNHNTGVDRFVAISKYIQKRIHDFYGRESDLVYPPVDTDWLRPARSAGDDFDLIVSALVPYKRVDLAVAAYARLPERRLRVVGTGTEYESLRSAAPPNVEFLGWSSDDDVRELYQGCRLLVFPGEEDFGIVPLEAMACGKPVVAFRRGGATETVREGLSGVFFDTQEADDLAQAVRIALDTKWDAEAIRDHAEAFGATRFLAEMGECVERTLE